MKLNLWRLQIVKTFGLVDDRRFHAIMSIIGFLVVDNSSKHALNIKYLKEKYARDTSGFLCKTDNCPTTVKCQDCNINKT